MGVEELDRLFDGQIQHVGDRLVPVRDLQRLAIIPPALARLAGHEDVRQEVHLDLLDALALA